MAEQLLNFDYSKATLGASLGYTNEGTIKIATYVSFETDSYFDGFVSFGDNYKYGFKKDGKFYTEEGKFIGTLGIVASSINQNTGTIITRGDDAEKFSISTLQPRETVALTCLQSMLSSFDVPLNIDNTKIKQLVSKSFMFAQEFVNQAVKYREKETTSSTATSEKNVSVDSSSLNSDTDKILYNIQVALNNLITQGKNQFTEQQKNGLKLAVTDVNIKTVPDNIKTVVSGNVNASVTGSVDSSISGSIDANVTGSVDSSISGSIGAYVTGSVDSSISGSIGAYVSGSVDSSVSGSISASVSGSVTTGQVSAPSET